jgi:predicted nucleic acid-binding protein
MRFWDASAVVCLLFEEPSSKPIVDLYHSDAQMLVWWGTVVECVSAISRREREGAFDLGAAVWALDRLDALACRWNEIQPTGHVRDFARRLLRVHALRATDALQLAAAQVVAQGAMGEVPFVCLDKQLAAAAAREGFRVLP